MLRWNHIKNPLGRPRGLEYKDSTGLEKTRDGRTVTISGGRYTGIFGAVPSTTGIAHPHSGHLPLLARKSYPHPPHTPGIPHLRRTQNVRRPMNNGTPASAASIHIGTMMK